MGAERDRVAGFGRLDYGLRRAGDCRPDQAQYGAVRNVGDVIAEIATYPVASPRS